MSIRVIGDPSAATNDVRVFDSVTSPADAGALAQLRSGVGSADLAAPAVVLPDFHHKENLEMPSSIAVATRGTIRPTLTSASVNCGMAMIALDAGMPSQHAIEAFYRGVRERYPFPPTGRAELKTSEVLRCATEGGSFAVERWNVDAADLDRVEENGRVDVDRYGGADRLRRELPRALAWLASRRFGTVGPRNHFIELQVVEEVFDERAAELLGLRAGGMTLQYHAGGGVLTGEIGALFGRRKLYPPKLRIAMASQKPLFHLATARSFAQIRERFALYFSGACPPVPRDGDEGNRLLLANAAAMNYGFAFRLATYSALRELARRHLGADASKLIVDSPHNSIYEEEVDGATAVVHRHNSCRAFPASRMTEHPVFSITGQPLLLPGLDRTSSYVCVADEGAEKSLFSACHGAGTMIDDFEARGLSGPDPLGRATLRFGYSDSAPRSVPHLDDRGVDEALGILASNGLVRPVVRVRPFAVLN